MTRHRCYQMPWGFLTVDTQTEQTPDGFLAEFPVNMDETDQIKQGAKVEVVDEELVITPVEELGE